MKNFTLIIIMSSKASLSINILIKAIKILKRLSEISGENFLINKKNNIAKARKK